MICLGHARISFPRCLLLPSFFLPPTTKLFQTHNDHNDNHLQAGGSGVVAIVGWEWRTRDADASRVPGMFLFLNFILLLIFITATLLLQEAPVAATEVDEASQQTRTREVDRTQRINESTGTRQMVNPPGFFFLFFLNSLLNFCISYNNYLDDHDHDRQ